MHGYRFVNLWSRLVWPFAETPTVLPPVRSFKPRVFPRRIFSLLSDSIRLNNRARLKLFFRLFKTMGVGSDYENSCPFWW